MNRNRKKLKTFLTMNDRNRLKEYTQVPQYETIY